MGIKTELLKMLMSGDGRSAAWCLQPELGKSERSASPSPKVGIRLRCPQRSGQWQWFPPRHPPSLATTTTTANGCVAFILPTADGDVGAKTNSLLVLQNFCQDNKIKF